MSEEPEPNTQLDEHGNWPDGCGYQGYEFGASYPDSICTGARLLDADRGDSGGIDDIDEDIPCPICRPRAAVKWWKDRGNTNAKLLVNDIRKNRGEQPI